MFLALIRNSWQTITSFSDSEGVRILVGMRPVRIATELAELRKLTTSGEARRIRETARVSQGEVAAEVQVTACTVSRWEQAIRLPRGRAGVAYLRLLRRLEQMSADDAA